MAAPGADDRDCYQRDVAMQIAELLRARAPKSQKSPKSGKSKLLDFEDPGHSVLLWGFKLCDSPGRAKAAARWRIALGVGSSSGTLGGP